MKSKVSNNLNLIADRCKFIVIARTEQLLIQKILVMKFLYFMEDLLIKLFINYENKILNNGIQIYEVLPI